MPGRKVNTKSVVCKFLSLMVEELKMRAHKYNKHKFFVRLIKP
jgi:hypothetical protein